MTDDNNSTEVQWLIKTATNKQVGPFSTKDVLRMIREGVFKGDESIQKYPGGKWKPISSRADFYDQLLTALKEQSKKKEPFHEKPAPTPIEDMETVIVPFVPKKSIKQKSEAPEEPLSPLKPLGPSVLPEKIVNELKQQSNVESLNIQTPSPKLTPSSESISKSSSSTSSKTGPIFFLVFTLFLLGAVAFFLLTSNNQKSKKKVVSNISLVVPKSTKGKSLSPQEIKNRIGKAVALFQMDSGNELIQAQSLIVSVIESEPTHKEARGLLCLVYKSLWPLVRQTSSDLEAVNIASKSARSLDPVGIDGYYCEATKLMIYGKYQEAKGIVDYTLNQPSFTSAAVLYSFKAEIIAAEGDPRTAILYSQKAEQLWPDWLRTKVEMADYLQKSNQANAAIQIYDQILKINPNHKEVFLRKAILLNDELERSNEAFDILASALRKPGYVSPLTESQALYVYANLLSAKKDLTQAQIMIKKAYDLNPTNRSIANLFERLGGKKRSPKEFSYSQTMFIGDQYARTGNHLAAQAEYKAAFDVDPQNALAALKAGKSLWELNQRREAINYVSRAISADKKLLPAYLTLSDYLSQQHQYSQAIQALNQASQHYRNNSEVLRNYGLVELRRNNVRDALSYLSRSFKLFENDIETLILLAKAYGLSNDFIQARQYAVRAIELDNTNNEAHIIYAKILTQFQGLDSGILYLKDLINKFSYSLEYRMALAEIYLEKDRFSDALKLYSQILEANPKQKEAAIGVGDANLKLGYYEKALRAYFDAAVIDPSDPRGLINAGMVYFQTGRNKEAITQFERALKVNPSYPRIFFYMGQAAFKDGQYQVALKFAAEEKNLNPSLADPYILSAEIYSSSKQFQKCATEYEQAIKLRPKGAELYVKLARCHRQTGNIDIAENMLNLAATQESGYPEIYKEQGAIFEQRSDITAAVVSYQKYLVLSPNAPDRAAIEERIQKISSGN